MRITKIKMVFNSIKRKTIMIAEMRAKEGTSNDEINKAIEIINRAITKIESSTTIRINSKSNSINQGNEESII